MREFARLYAALDASTSTAAKVQALREHLSVMRAADAAWAVYLLSGGKPRQAVPTAILRRAAREAAGIEEWLFEESYQVVGDLAETIAHVLPHDLLNALPNALPQRSSMGRGGSGHAESDHRTAGMIDAGMMSTAVGLISEAGRSSEAGLSAQADLTPEAGLSHWMLQGLLPLRRCEPEEQIHRLRAMWSALLPPERFLLTKLVGGGFRVGVSRLLVQRAVADLAQLEPSVVAQRMMGYTQASHQPSEETWHELVRSAEGDQQLKEGQPYPFFLAQALESSDAADDQALMERLGPASDWMAEWKFDGIRAQVVRRGQGVWIWSRGEELITERFPEVAEAAMNLPEGTVLDGELLVMREGQPAPFAELQTRITRKVVSRSLRLRTPVAFVAYDLLELQGCDVRAQAQRQRREQLENLMGAVMEGHTAPLVAPLVAPLMAPSRAPQMPDAEPSGRAEPNGASAAASGATLRCSPLVPALDWKDWRELRAGSRERGVEGLMLKHAHSPYGTGRRKVEAAGLATTGWWKWKIEPMTVDAVLIYAQAGHGRRANLYTDYTFAVWSREPRDEDEVQAVLKAIERREPPDEQGLRLVPFAKAYSGLTDEEFKQVDRVIRASTVEKFGPVRSVVPSLVFELGFEGIARSTRHKSGVAVRFPRMLRWRTDKPLREADVLETLVRFGGGDL